MTGIIKKAPQAEGAEYDRDETIQSDWFSAFRSGDYPQGKMSPEDVDEIAEEFNLTGRRPPVVFDHLTPEDFGENAKPGPAAGFVTECRAVDTTDSRFPGTRELQLRVKVGYSASWRTREGMYRNLSVGLYKCKTNPKKKEMYALHHLALLGSAPPAVAGLPEVIFSERNRADSIDSILSFACEGGIPVRAPSESPTNIPSRSNVITFTETEHKAVLGELEAKLKLAHSSEIATFKEQVAKVQDELADATTALETTKGELEATKASIPLAVEAAKQEGIVEGAAQAKLTADRLFEEQKAENEIISFCEELRKTGRLTEQEFKGTDTKPSMSKQLLAMPAQYRDSMRDLLKARPSVPGTNFSEEKGSLRGEKPEGTTFDEDALAKEATAHAKANGLSFRESLSIVKSNKTKSTEE